MKTLTLEQIMALNPYWLKNKEQMEKFYEILARQEEWSALDVLALPDNEITAENKLWIVLREVFISAPILHEFACQCAESALALLENPDPRSVAAIETRRKWLNGEIDDLSALDNAVDNAYAAWCAAKTAADAAAGYTAWYATKAKTTAGYTAWCTAVVAAWRGTEKTAWNELVAILTKLLTD